MVRENPSPTFVRRTRSRASCDSGPTWMVCTRSSAKADTTPRGSSSAQALERPSSTQPARPSGAARRTGAPGPKGGPSTGRHRRPPRPERRRPPIGGIQARPGKRLAGRLGRPILGSARGPPRGPGAVAPARWGAPPRGSARGGHRGQRTTGVSRPRPDRMRACGIAEAEHPTAPLSTRWSCRCRDPPTGPRRSARSGSSPGTYGGSRAPTRAR